METTTTRALLESEGYRVLFREGAWCECLVSVADERWWGRGVDESDALNDVLRQMFPSHAARALLSRALRPATVRPPSLRPPSLRPEAPSPEAIPLAARVPEGLPSIEPANETVPPPAPAEEPARTEPATPAEPAPTASRAERFAPVVSARVLDRRADGALDEIDALMDEISAREESLAMATPVRQRLVITGWIADARRAQDTFPEEERVRTSVAKVAGRLSRLCRLWWCGSVRALQADRRPEAVLGELPYTTDALPRDWSEVTAIAEDMLERMDRDDLRAGRDELGWSDADRLLPAPGDPEATLRELVSAIDATAGSADIFPPRGLPDPKLLARWVARLRWLRASPIDGAQWARAMGRCRWWASHDPSRYSEASAMLEPSFRPEGSWAALLTSPTKDRERRRLVKEVFTQAPAVKDHPDAAALLSWLAKALPLADTHHAQIVTAMEPFRAEVLSLDPMTFPNGDRRIRRRLLALQRDLGARVEVPEAVDEPDALAAEPEAGPEAVSAEEARPPLLDAVRHRTEGTRALFISNRNDPMLQDRLVRALGFSELDWCEADVKRAQAAEQKVSSGGYDFVLAATGFLSHSVDGRLSKVCRARKIPYVRVERGRPLTCVRSLARDLGLSG